jgi:hypothetical protein
VQRKIHLIFPRLDNYWRENGEKNPIFWREKKTYFPDFPLGKRQEKSDPIKGIGLSFLLVPPNGIEPPTY